MMVRLPTLAEKKFSLDCTEADAVATRPDEDINGWDYLVEFASKGYGGPPESSPAKLSAFVQVKSSISERPRTSIKLSNMLTACSSPDPWFIVMITASGKVYGVHVWSELIEKSLIKIRRAGIDGIPLNRRSLSITFPSHTRITNNIAIWMQNAITAEDGEYSARKRLIYEESGYDDGYAIGRISLSDHSEEEISLAFLGLKQEVGVRHFSITKTRFGICDQQPMLDLADSTISIDPEPVSTCEVRIKGAEDEPTLELCGTIFSFLPPGSPHERGRLRFSTPPIEFIYGPENTGKVILNLNSQDQYPLSHLNIYAKLTRWAREAPLEMRITAQNKKRYYFVYSTR